MIIKVEEGHEMRDRNPKLPWGLKLPASVAWRGDDDESYDVM